MSVASHLKVIQINSALVVNIAYRNFTRRGPFFSFPKKYAILITPPKKSHIQWKDIENSNTHTLWNCPEIYELNPLVEEAVMLIGCDTILWPVGFEKEIDVENWPGKVAHEFSVPLTRTHYYKAVMDYLFRTHGFVVAK
jgi:hypothetical protein